MINLALRKCGAVYECTLTLIPNYARANRSDACKEWKNLVLTMWRTTTVDWCSSTVVATMMTTRKAIPSSRQMIPRYSDPACGACSPSYWTTADPRDPRARRASGPWSPYQHDWGISYLDNFLVWSSKTWWIFYRKFSFNREEPISLFSFISQEDSFKHFNLRNFAHCENVFSQYEKLS